MSELDKSLIHAIECHSVEGVKNLIAHGVDVKATRSDDWKGSTALHYAASYTGKEALENAKLFIEHGADVNAKTELGDTPLHCAVSHECNKMAMLLIEKGADVNAVNSRNETPLGLLQDRVEKIPVVQVLQKAQAAAKAAAERRGIAPRASFTTEAQGAPEDTERGHRT